jgi:hypothetical protein
LRTYLPPARSPGRNRSDDCGVPPSRGWQATTIAYSRNVAVFSANTAATPIWATSSPAIAGPIARARLMLIELSAAAAGTCARGTMSGTSDW